jgi:ubiquinone/menaquinone biosynthesis C-methylase UbiE
MPKILPFEHHADEYEDWFTRNRLAYESEIRAIRSLYPEAGLALEIGVGTGRFAAPLGIELGIDPCLSMSNIAQRRDITVIGGVAEALPFKNELFDITLMVTTLCFLDDVEGSLREMFRVSKPHGYAIIAMIDRDSPLGKAYEKRKQKSVFYRDADFYSAGEVIALLEKVGFGEFDVAQTIFRDPSEIIEIEPVREGLGEGSFVVIRGQKQAR